MVDRVSKVTLTAQVNHYLQGMDQAARKTQATSTEIDKLAQKKQAFQTLGASAMALGTAIAAGLTVAIVKYAQFDQAMSNANAVLQESAQNQQLLKDAALEAGGATVFTARESANAIEELGKAGISTSDILSGALVGSLDLAASGQLGVARAAEITGITLKQFNLEGSEAGRVADVLSAGANKAVGSVEDLANGLKFVGPVASSMNVSLEDTTATLALFADRGVIGEQAGTSLRGMLSSLTSPSKQAKAEIDKLGITLYDSQGKFLGLENVAGQLQTALHGTDDASRDMALGVLFGNQQITAARILVDAGSEGWRDYRDAVDDAGVAGRIAAERLDNLAGDVEKLGGAFDTALIRSGSAANDILRDIVQTATFLVDAIGGAPQPVLDTAFAVGSVAAAVALAGGASLIAVPKIASFKTSLAALGTTGRTAAIGIGLATGALAMATIAVGGFLTLMANREGRIDSFRDSLDEATGAITDYTRELLAKRLVENGATETMDRLGLTTGEVVDVLVGGKAALAEWTDAQKAASGGSIEAQNDYHNLGIVLGGLTTELEAGKSDWEAIKKATSDATTATKNNEKVIAALEGSARSAGVQIDELAEIIRGFASATLSSRDAERQFQAAIDDATDSLTDQGATLDISTEAGRANEQALDDIAKASLELAAARLEETGNQDLATAAIQAGRDALIEQLAQYGITGAEAEAYADKLGLIPSNIGTAVSVTGIPEAQGMVDRFITDNTGRVIGLNIQTSGDRVVGYGRFADGGLMDYMGGQSVLPNARGNIYSGGRPLYKFAEPETGWEAFISGKSSERDRNLGIWADVGNRLGAWKAAGGLGQQQSTTNQQVSISVDIHGDAANVTVDSMANILDEAWKRVSK